MSKPTARVILVTLIGLVLVAAAYLTVQGVFAKADTAAVQAHTVSGVQTNFNHDRSSASELQVIQVQSESYSPHGSGRGHGCESEMQTSPLD
jgi:hypothetical protein